MIVVNKTVDEASRIHGPCHGPFWAKSAEKISTLPPLLTVA